MLIFSSTQLRRYKLVGIDDFNSDLVRLELEDKERTFSMKVRKENFPPYFMPIVGQILTMDDSGRIVYARPCAGDYVALPIGWQRNTEGVPIVNEREARDVHAKNGKNFTVPPHKEAYFAFEVLDLPDQIFGHYTVVHALPLPFVSFNGMLALKGWGVKKFTNFLEAFNVNVADTNIEYASNEDLGVVLERIEKVINRRPVTISVDDYGFVAFVAPLPDVVVRQISAQLTSVKPVEQGGVSNSAPKVVPAQSSNPVAVPQTVDLGKYPATVQEVIKRALEGSAGDIAILRGMALLDPTLNSIIASIEGGK